MTSEKSPSELRNDDLDFLMTVDYVEVAINVKGYG
jgi:hypothetical protein